MRDDLRLWARSVSRRARQVGRGPGCKPVSVQFTEEQTAAFRDALSNAQLAVLRGIAREADRPDSYDGPRNVNRLVSALQGLNEIARGAPGGGWFAYAPGTGEVFDVDSGEDPD